MQCAQAKNQQNSSKTFLHLHCRQVVVDAIIITIIIIQIHVIGDIVDLNEAPPSARLPLFCFRILRWILLELFNGWMDSGANIPSHQKGMWLVSTVQQPRRLQRILQFEVNFCKNLFVLILYFHLQLYFVTFDPFKFKVYKSRFNENPKSLVTGSCNSME